MYPVEYKKGKPKDSQEDILQLAAQAMCLEEMFCTEIPEGAVFYGETRRRQSVAISDELRSRVRSIFDEMHRYYGRAYTPGVKRTKACNACSLKDICLSKLEKTLKVKTYIEQHLSEDDT